jgi:EmrB/QacA subfamily drug resistance transporter
MVSFRSGAAPMPATGAPGRRLRQVILLICSLSLFMTYVDSTILNVALPTIARQFRVGVADLQWVADAYLLVLSSFIMLVGSLADRIGRRRVFMSGLLLFSAGSLLCSVAPSVQLLILFRMLQAIGGCMLTPVSLSILRQVFTDPVERARAIGVWSAIFGIGIATGPILGGVLVSGIGWRSVFWVNVPVGAAAWVLARTYVPESRAPAVRRVDPAGQLLVILLLSSTTFAVIDGASLTWGSAPIVSAFSLGALSLLFLIVIERSRFEPLIELHFFRSPTFSVAIGAAVTSFLALSGFLFVNTLYLQEVRGDSAFTAGISLLPATVAIAASAVVSGRLVARYGPRLPMVLAGFGIALGGALLLDLKPDTPYGLLVGSYLLLGLGFGLINPPITNSAVTGMPPEQAGVASATVSTSRQVGSVLGIAIMGSLITGAALGSGRLLPAHASAFTSSTHLVWILVTACGVVCALIAALFTGPRGLRAAASVYDDTPASSPAVIR